MRKFNFSFFNRMLFNSSFQPVMTDMPNEILEELLERIENESKACAWKRLGVPESSHVTGMSFIDLLIHKNINEIGLIKIIEIRNVLEFND